MLITRFTLTPLQCDVPPGRPENGTLTGRGDRPYASEYQLGGPVAASASNKPGFDANDLKWVV